MVGDENSVLQFTSRQSGSALYTEFLNAGGISFDMQMNPHYDSNDETPLQESVQRKFGNLVSSRAMKSLKWRY